MTPLGSLWLPVLLSAVAVFIASTIIHMLLSFWHKDDFRSFPNEDGVMTALRPFNIPPGDYMAPRCETMAEMKSPAFKEKFAKGPVFMATFLPAGQWTMGRSLVQWFIFVLVVSHFAGYVAGRALGPGADYMHVFRFAAVTAFLAYSGAVWPQSIWYRRSWMVSLKSTIDGLIYGCVTAGVFGWLWPR